MNCLRYLCLLLCPLLVSASEWPVEFTKIEKVNYDRNPRAKFCQRPVEMIDTIVIHHSASSSTTTAQRINDYHLERGTPEDPWYMIGYSYAINTPYLGQQIPDLKVTEGRPLELVGAHAGQNAFISMTSDQKRLWEEGKVVCGRENEPLRVDPDLLRNGKIKANVTTLGLVIIGNYAPFSRLNPFGLSSLAPQYLIEKGQDLTARISCQLQKKYPGIKYIKWHNFYMATTCPGTIEKYIERIRILSRKYGCNFN